MYCVIGHFYKVKRVYFKFEFEVVTPEPNTYETGKLTELYVAHQKKSHPENSCQLSMES